MKAKLRVLEFILPSRAQLAPLFFVGMMIRCLAVRKRDGRLVFDEESPGTLLRADYLRHPLPVPSARTHHYVKPY